MLERTLIIGSLATGVPKARQGAASHCNPVFRTGTKPGERRGSPNTLALISATTHLKIFSIVRGICSFNVRIIRQHVNGSLLPKT
jgi:hypothetical protein